MDTKESFFATMSFFYDPAHEYFANLFQITLSGNRAY